MNKITHCYHVKCKKDFLHLGIRFKQAWMYGQIWSTIGKSSFYVQKWSDGDMTWSGNNDEGVPVLPVYEFETYLKQIEQL